MNWKASYTYSSVYSCKNESYGFVFECYFNDVERSCLERIDKGNGEKGWTCWDDNYCIHTAPLFPNPEEAIAYYEMMK